MYEDSFRTQLFLNLGLWPNNAALKRSSLLFSECCVYTRAKRLVNHSSSVSNWFGPVILFERVVSIDTQV